MKPLHHSVLFWLGIFPGLFLLWSWVDSSRFATLVQTPLPGGNVVVEQTQGRIVARLITGTAAARGWDFGRYAHNTETDAVGFFPRPGFGTEEIHLYGPTGKERYLVMPHWLLLCLWFVFFLVGLDMRNKRRQLIEELPPEDSGPPAD